MFSSVMSSSQTEMCVCGDDFQNTCQFTKIPSRPPGGGSASAEGWSPLWCQVSGLDLLSCGKNSAKHCGDERTGR